MKVKQKYLEAFMDMTERFSQTSEAERLKVGACIVKECTPISFGINGTPPGFYTNVCEDSSGKTSEFVLHAEIQALNKLRTFDEFGKEFWLQSVEGCSIFVTHLPCINCAKEIVRVGISEVYYRYRYRSLDGLLYLLENDVVVKEI